MQFARRHHYRPPKRAVRRRQKRRFIPTVTTPAGEDIDHVLCNDWTTESGFLEVVVSFNLLITDPSTLTAAQINDLDYYNDGVVGYDDRDFWLDQLIRRNITVTSRLSFADATPVTKAQSDPLGLTDGLTNRIIIDPLNTVAAGGVGVFIKESSTNQCYQEEGRTTLASHGVGGSNLLFSGADATTYNYDVWCDIRSLFSGDSGSINQRRFPDTDAEVVVYIRGGDYTLDRVCTIINQESNSIDNPDLNPSRIIIRNYPGEVVNFYFGNPASNNDILLTLSRPDLKIDGITINGFRVSGSDRIFAPNVMSVTNAADRFELRNCTLRNFRAIATDHPDAGRLPHYVDSEFANRSLSSDELTGKMILSYGIQFGVNNVGSKLLNCTIHPAGDDFPPSVTVPGGSTGTTFGETIDVAGVTSLTIRKCTISGTSSHGAIRVRASSGVTPSGLIIEYNDMRNPENSVLLLSNMDDSFVRYNRIHDFANRQDLAANDGYGITPGDGHGNEIVDNVIWLGDTQGGETNYGIAVQVSQSDSTTEWTDNLIARNIIYRCGIFLGYSSGTMAVAPGRITLNVIEDNVIDGVSDYNATDPNADGPIVTNVGPHTSDLYTNIIQNNILRQRDDDTTAVVEKVNPSTFNDYKITDQSPWLVGNSRGNPMFVDPDNGDFTLEGGSPASSLIESSTPVHPDDLADVFPYTCPVIFDTATFTYRQRYYQGWLDLNMPPQAKQLIGGTP